MAYNTLKYSLAPEVSGAMAKKKELYKKYNITNNEDRNKIAEKLKQLWAKTNGMKRYTEKATQYQ